MIVKIAKWENDLALRIPSAVAREVNLREGACVDISVVDGALLVRPIDEARVYVLDDLLRGITEENRHGEIATVQGVGSEA